MIEVYQVIESIVEKTLNEGWKLENQQRSLSYEVKAISLCAIWLCDPVLTVRQDPHLSLLASLSHKLRWIFVKA